VAVCALAVTHGCTAGLPTFTAYAENSENQIVTTSITENQPVTTSITQENTDTILTGSADVLNLTSASAILMEASTGQIIYEKNSNTSVAPASITKIMTLLLIFDALEAGNIKLTDEVTVSEYAASMGGSQVFLEAGEVQTVDTMIKCIAVASANDACVSMAEFIGGTEDAFVEKMNERAKGLGMESTHFVNCCGLDTEGHVSSAMDVAIMSRELITKYPQIHDYSTIWMDTITHTTRRGSTEFGLTNTNKLIKQYQWATGLKTGSTSKAGCCLSATATKDGIDLIAVVMTAPDSKTRFSEAISLLNYGFANCYIYMDDEDFEIEPVAVIGGKLSSVTAKPEKTFSYMFMSKPDTDKITRRFEMTDGVAAPVACGDIVGEIVYEYEGRELGRVSILASEDVAKAQFSDAVRKVFTDFFN
jgi:D-alanyl-D-alanine carboxypeptidase (penicillin-binding protein 5/6)